MKMFSEMKEKELKSQFLSILLWNSDFYTSYLLNIMVNDALIPWL